MIKDYSFGIIPVYKNSDGKYEFLIINQKTYNGSFWGFPKGHAENGESEIESAIRELKEEVGITDITIDENNAGKFSYNFKQQGNKYDKTVKYWLGFVKEKAIIIQQEELNGYKRVSYDTALKTLSHQNMKKIFIKITKDLFVIN